MAYLKRSEMSKSWPVPRKGTAYIARSSHMQNDGISLLFLLRDVLRLAKTRKEVRSMTLAGEIKVNNKIRKDEAFPVQVFDVLNLESMKKNYRLDIVNRKFKLVEVSGKEASTKIVKISGKKILDSKVIQMNLADGQNFISKEKFSVGDSIVLNTKDDKIEKILPLGAGSRVEIISGKHAGEKGELKSTSKLVRGNVYKIKIGDKEVDLPPKTILVIG